MPADDDNHTTRNFLMSKFKEFITKHWPQRIRWVGIHLGRLTLLAFLIANLVVIAMMWTCCLATYIHPAVYPRLSLLPLLFPIFLLLDLLFIVFWLIVKWKRVWVPLVGLLACISFVRDYFPINIPSTPPDDAIKVMSFNTRSLGSAKQNGSDGPDRLISYLSTSGCDIICLQESGIWNKREAHHDSVMRVAGYDVYRYHTEVLYSRLPILHADSLVYPTRGNHGIRAKLLHQGDTILLINNHFESNRLVDSVKTSYKEALNNPVREEVEREVTPMLRLLVHAAPNRAIQADTIHHIVHDWLPRPVIVCGDFNDTPVSYVHRVVADELDDAFRSSGNGLGFTYHERGFPVRIDHILYSGEHFRSHQTHIDQSMKLSDHYPIITSLERK